MTTLVAETKVLFLVIRALRLRTWSPTLYASLELLCRSSNAAIARKGHKLVVSLTEEEDEHNGQTRVEV